MNKKKQAFICFAEYKERISMASKMDFKTVQIETDNENLEEIEEVLRK